MKIILANRDERGHLGGDAIQLRGYQRALQDLGHSTEYTHGQLYANPNEYKYYDEMWSLHSNFDWAYWPFQKAKAARIKFRWFPIFYKGVHVNITNEQIQEMAEYASDIYFLSSQEQREFHEELSMLKATSSYNPTKEHVIPNGIDDTIFNTTGAKYPSPTDYVISTGRFAGEKGFHHIIKACKKLDIPVVIIGANWDNDYRDEIKRIWDKASVLEQMDQQHVAMYLRAANTYVCAAQNERNNLALIEGIACGAKPISSDGNRGNQFFPGINTVPFGNEQSLIEAIKTVYSAEKTQKTAYYIPSWKDVVQLILT
jgi:glycosyltransferase involved in cell wall biosynthesis